jgi:hypothetical protein
MSDLTDAFVLWASEFGLIDIYVDEDGELSFTRAACQHEVEGLDDFDLDDFGLDDPVVSAPAPVPAAVHRVGKHRAPRRRRHRLPLAAVPVAAGAVVASAAAYAVAQRGPEVSSNIAEVGTPGPSPVRTAASPTPVFPAVAEAVRTVVGETATVGGHLSRNPRRVVVVPASRPTHAKGKKKPKREEVVLPESASSTAKNVVKTVTNLPSTLLPTAVPPVVPTVVAPVVDTVKGVLPTPSDTSTLVPALPAPVDPPLVASP